MTIDVDRDVFMVFAKEDAKNWEPERYSIPAHVLLFSYNRPRLVREAIESVTSQSYRNWTLHLIDDGSDCFSARALADSVDAAFPGQIKLWEYPVLPPDYRATHSRLAENVNRVMDTIPRGEAVFYLCDDDLMAPNFMTMAIQVISEYKVHVVQGQLMAFFEGQDWRTESISGMPYAKGGPRFEHNTLWWSSGSFCHLSDCYWDERLRWKENGSGHSQDAQFILDLWHLHRDICIVDKPAYYRREHTGTISAKLGKFKEDGKTWKTEGKPLLDLTGEMVAGEME